MQPPMRGGVLGDCDFPVELARLPFTYNYLFALLIKFFDLSKIQPLTPSRIRPDIDGRVYGRRITRVVRNIKQRDKHVHIHNSMSFFTYFFLNEI